MKQDQEEQRHHSKEQGKEGGPRLNRRDRKKMEMKEQNRLDLEKIENELQKLVVDHQELEHEFQPPLERNYQEGRKQNRRQNRPQNQEDSRYDKRQGEERQWVPREQRGNRRQQRQWVPREDRKPRQQRERRPRQQRERRPRQQRKPRQQRQQLSRQERQLLRQKKKQQRMFRLQQLEKLQNEGFVIVSKQQSFRNKDRIDRRNYEKYHKLREQIEGDQQIKEQRPNRGKKTYTGDNNAAEDNQAEKEQPHQYQKRKKKYQRKNYDNNQEQNKKDESVKKQASQISEKQVEDPPQCFLCPIGQVLMVSPVILATCGHTFEETVIRDWLKKQLQCPLCKRQTSQNAVIKNFALAQALSNFK